MSLPLNQMILGDCGEVMAEWPGNSVDCVVTDPPYRIGFMGKSWDRALPPRRAFRQILRVLKPGALAFVMSSPRQDVLWRMLAMLEGVGFELRQSFVSWIYKTGFPKAYDVAKGIEGREVLGTANWSEWSKLKGEELKDRIGYHKLQANQGYRPKDYTEKKRIGKVDFTSDLAKKWEGWKSITGLKPALECVLMINKPLSERTIVDNVLKWGTGAMNADACRIPFQNEEDKEDSKHNWKPDSDYPANGTVYEYGSEKLSTHQSPRGRFPANLLVQDGALDTGEITKSGILEPHHHISEERAVYGEYTGRESISSYGDEGGPFRYFDLDAWSRHHGFLDVPKPSRSEKNLGLYNMPKGEPPQTGRSKPALGRKTALGTPTQNFHPTVKPVKLMAYLIELGCPKGGVVVDPFAGSGTTCIAAKKLGRRWIGIEINPEYAKIAEARINPKGPLDGFLEVKP